VHPPNVFLRACITRAPKPNDLDTSNHIRADLLAGRGGPGPDRSRGQDAVDERLDLLLGAG